MNSAVKFVVVISLIFAVAAGGLYYGFSLIGTRGLVFFAWCDGNYVVAQVTVGGKTYNTPTVGIAILAGTYDVVGVYAGKTLHKTVVVPLHDDLTWVRGLTFDFSSQLYQRTVKVVDDFGNPWQGANVSISHGGIYQYGDLSYETPFDDGVTDQNGCFTIQTGIVDSSLFYRVVCPSLGLNTMSNVNVESTFTVVSPHGGVLMCLFTYVPSTGGYITLNGSAWTIAGSIMYPKDSQLSLEAHAVGGYVFDHWVKDGVNAGSSGTLGFALNQNSTVRAIFAVDEINPPPNPPPPPTHLLTIITNGTGTVSGAQNGTYSDGQVLSITAQGETWIGGHSNFSYWFLDGTQVITNPVTVTMNDDHVLVAVFTSNNEEPFKFDQNTIVLLGMVAVVVFVVLVAVAVGRARRRN